MELFLTWPDNLIAPISKDITTQKIRIEVETANLEGIGTFISLGLSID